MAQSQCNKNRPSGGFTVIEVLVASVVLMVGLMAAAGLIGGTIGNTARSEYMNQAATLATEKLEDLNRYPSADPNIAVTSGSSAGSLTSNVLQNVTTNGVTVPVSYYDEVYFSPTQGALAETNGTLDSSGAAQYLTVTYTPDGHMSAPVQSTTAPSASGSIAFQRRWIIDQDQPVTGVRRVTVLVTLLNQAVKPVVTFQMSMVRP